MIKTRHKITKPESLSEVGFMLHVLKEEAADLYDIALDENLDLIEPSDRIEHIRAAIVIVEHAAGLLATLKSKTGIG